MSDKIDRATDLDEHDDLSTRDDLEELSDSIMPDIKLSEIGSFDEGGNFKFKEGVEQADENGEIYIEINGNKYYDIKCRDVEDSSKKLYYITNSGSKNGKTVGFIYFGESDNRCIRTGYGVEYCSDKGIYRGNWEDDRRNGEGSMHYPSKQYYKGNWKYDKREGKGTQYYENGEKLYEGNWKDGKFNGEGTQYYENGKVYYEGNWKDGKFNGEGTRYDNNGDILKGHWNNGDFDFKEKGIETYANGEKYEGHFLPDKNGKPRPFCYKNRDKNIDVYKDWLDIQTSQGVKFDKNFEKMEGIRTLPDGTEHKYTLTNSTITEKANDFITMYGDRKPNEDRSAERGNIIYTVHYESDYTEYEIKSWGRSIKWKFEGGAFKFENKKGEILSIPQKESVPREDSDFDEKAAMHAANLINKVRRVNDNAHDNRPYRYNGNELRATKTSYTPTTDATGKIYKDGTVLIEDVKEHFGETITAKSLAEWLNGGY